MLIVIIVSNFLLYTPPSGRGVVLKFKVQTTPTEGSTPDVRRVTVSDASSLNFADLRHRAGVSFGPNFDFRFRWLDEEGDLCTIASNDELAEAVALCNSRLTVLVELAEVKKEEKPADAKAPAPAAAPAAAPSSSTPGLLTAAEAMHLC